MIIQSAQLLGGICLCRKSFTDDTERSDCCFTPYIEAESTDYLGSTIIIDLKKAKTIRDPGFAAYVVNEDLNIQLIIFQLNQGEFYALSRFCTHGGQIVSFIRERGLVQCNNFNHSIFKVSGSVYKGPAPGPLESYPVKVQDDHLFIEMP